MKSCENCKYIKSSPTGDGYNEPTYYETDCSHPNRVIQEKFYSFEDTMTGETEEMT
jgi:hypothetical protein